MMRLLSVFFLLVFTALPAYAAGSGPAIWRLADEDTTLHIFGSVHVLKPGTVWLGGDLQALVAGADTIYMELSPADQTPQVMQPLVAKYGLLPEGDVLKNHLPPALYSTLSTELTGLGMTEAQFTRFKPWLATTVYATYKFIKLGFTPQAGVEATLMNMAQANGTPVAGIETAEYQLSLFDTMSAETEIAFLEQTLADRHKLVEMMETITALWTSGNTKGLAALFDEAFGAYPALQEKLLTDRNYNWTGNIETIMDQPGEYLLVVGTGHLVGEKSVIQMLQQKGLPITREH